MIIIIRTNDSKQLLKDDMPLPPPSRGHGRGGGECSRKRGFESICTTSHSNKSSKTLTPNLVDVVGDNDDMDNYGCGTAAKAVMRDAEL